MDGKSIVEIADKVESDKRLLLSSNKGRPLNCCGAQKYACERMLTPYSGCIIADWTYRTKKVWWGKSAEMEDCDFVELERIVDHGSMIRANESIYVPYGTLHDFVEQVLPNITAPFVLITGTYEVDAHIAASTYDYFLAWAAVLQHPYLLHLYNMNPWFHHPKQSGWPYGIMRPLKYEPFYDAAIEKNETGLYFGPLGLSNLGRLGLPGFLGIRENAARLHASHTGKSKRVPFEEYAQLLASHQFVLSPYGDRKDCARNYEALGLGTQPVTDLDIRDYDFYKNCGLIFDEDLNDWENLKLKPARVERRVVLNEYWASKLSHAIRTRDFRLHC